MPIPSVLHFQRRMLSGLLLLAAMLVSGCAILEEKDETAGWTAEQFLTVGQKQMRLELQRQLDKTQKLESRLFVTEDVYSSRAANWAHPLPGNFTCL